MNQCDRCKKSYSEKFSFCPFDGTTLRPAVEREPQFDLSASPRSKFRVGKWCYGVLAVAIVAGAVLVFMSSRAAPSPDQADSPPPVADEGNTQTKPLAKKRSASPRRAPHSRSTVEPDEPRTAGDAVAQQVHVQELVATGYRKIQQRDYEGAHDAFEQALEIDPHNSAAQKGLSAAQTAQSVEGLAGVFKR